MPATNDFLADPLGFMKANVVLVRYLNDFNTVNNGGVVPMTLNYSDDYTGVTVKGNKPMNVCILSDGRNRNDAFPAFWCPYDQDRLGWTTLSRFGDYMFTATMDGCSFGIGSATKDGTRLVGHANSANLDTPDSHAPMISDQRQRLKGMLGKKSKVFEPKHYRKNHGMSTTFGLKDSKHKWRFYTQRYIQDMDVIRFIEVKKIC